jgi:hypothetical protein
MIVYKEKKQEVVEYEDPEAFSMERGSLAFVEIGKKKGKGNYTDQKAGYTDYRVVLNPDEGKFIDPNAQRSKRKEYRSVEDIKRDRENISYTMDEEMAERVLMQKRKEEEKEMRRKEEMDQYDRKLRNHYETMHVRQIGFK